jgi:hypothetical protein
LATPSCSTSHRWWRSSPLRPAKGQRAVERDTLWDSSGGKVRDARVGGACASQAQFPMVAGQGDLLHDLSLYPGQS